MTLPPCGLYSTTIEIAGIPAGRLVYFHNHGDPGPGLYLPQSWEHNRAQFPKQGTVLPDPAEARTLREVRAQGLYRVLEQFTCCDKQCRTFEPDMLVQLGYDGTARAILFTPTWTSSGLSLPKNGQHIDETRLDRIAPLRVAQTRPQTQEHLH